MTANTGKKLYYLYCFILGCSHLPVAYTLTVLLQIPSTNRDRVGICLVTIALLFFVAAWSVPYRFRWFKQFWPELSKIRKRMVGCLVLGVLVEKQILIHLVDPWITKVPNPELWFSLVITLPFAVCVLGLDIVLANVFETDQIPASK